MDYVQLLKPRLNLLVLATLAAGYALGSGRDLALGTLGWTLVGTALLAGGSSALNQWMERDIDARMHRTRKRPLPDGRLQPAEAMVFGAALVVLGVITLGMAVNGLTAALGAGTGLLYLVVYTPLKRLTPLNTFVGAIPGAMPPVMGWTAARGELGPEALALFGILFLWQMPHFLAIAWLYQDDYRIGGCRMLPHGDSGARRTGWTAALHGAALIPVALLPAVLGMAGNAYFFGALAMALAFFALAVHMAQRCGDGRARLLFRASLIFLPLLFALMVVDRVVP